MNTATYNQSAAINSQPFPVPEVKVCSNCSQELVAQETGRRTSFGLNVCDNCLYS